MVKLLLLPFPFQSCQFSVCCEAVVGYAKDSASHELLLLWDDWLHFDICLLICLHHSFLSNHWEIRDILQPQMADLSPSIHLNYENFMIFKLWLSIYNYKKRETTRKERNSYGVFFFLNKYGFSFLFLFCFYVYFLFNIIIDKYSLSIIKSLLKDGAEIV